jgi:hypothetical protein
MYMQSTSMDSLGARIKWGKVLEFFASFFPSTLLIKYFMYINVHSLAFNILQELIQLWRLCSTCIDTSCSRPCCISCVCVQRGGRLETVNGHLNLYLFYSNHKITAYTTAQVTIITVFSPEYIWSLIRGILLII